MLKRALAFSVFSPRHSTGPLIALVAEPNWLFRTNWPYWPPITLVFQNQKAVAQAVWSFEATWSGLLNKVSLLNKLADAAL